MGRRKSMGKLKNVLLTLLMFVILITLTACGNSSESDSKDISKKSGKSLKASDLSIDDFELETVPGKSDGYDCYITSLTNNSKYDVIGVSISYKVKDEVSEKELKVYDDFMKSHDGYINEYDSSRDVTLIGTEKALIEKGEKLTGLKVTVGFKDLCWYDYPTEEQFDLMEPKELTLGIVGNDNKIYYAYYDFTNKSWKLDEETVDNLNTWSNTELAQTIDEPNGKYYFITEDDDDELRFEVYGVSVDKYNEYLETLENLGFKEEYSSKSYYEGIKDDKKEIDVYYSESDAKLSVTLTLTD
jgi:hypothetical protein